MAVINRADLAGLIPEPVTKEIFQGVVENSAVLRLGRKLPNMTAKTQSINVLDMLPLAYWVDGDTGFKQTSSQAWEKKKLYAEELAVIIPIPEAVLDDSNYDIWGEVKPRIVEAMGRRIDDAVLFGNGAPSTWRDSIVDTAVNAGCSVTLGADLFQDILVNLWEQWPSFQGKSSVNTWVYSIARNTAVEYLRHRKKHIQFLTLDQELYHEIADDNSNLYQLLYELIERLDNDTDREILYLHLDKKTASEISSLTGISESAIRQRIHRTIEKLKKLNQQE